MQKCWYVPSVLYLICVHDIKRIQMIYLFISRTAFHGVQGDDGVRVLLVFHSIIFLPRDAAMLARSWES